MRIRRDNPPRNARGQILYDYCTKCRCEKTLGVQQWCNYCISEQRQIRNNRIDNILKEQEYLAMKRKEKQKLFNKVKEYIDRVETRNAKFLPYVMVSFDEVFELIDLWLLISEKVISYHTNQDPEVERSIMYKDIKKWLKRNTPIIDINKKSTLDKK